MANCTLNCTLNFERFDKTEFWFEVLTWNLEVRTTCKTAAFNPLGAFLGHITLMVSS